MNEGSDYMYMPEADNVERHIEDNAGLGEDQEITPVSDVIAETIAESPGGCMGLFLTFT